MPRSKDLALVERNQEIVAMISAGSSLADVAGKFGISRQRCSQIAQEYQEVISDDARRDILLTQMEGDLDILTGIIKNPGYVVTPGGMIVCEYYDDGRVDHRGKPVPDPSRPLIDKGLQVKGIEVATRLRERISKMYGIDRVRQRERDQSQEMDEFVAYVEKMSSENAELKAQVEKLSQSIPEAEVVP